MTLCDREPPNTAAAIDFRARKDTAAYASRDGFQERLDFSERPLFNFLGIRSPFPYTLVVGNRIQKGASAVPAGTVLIVDGEPGDLSLLCSLLAPRYGLRAANPAAGLRRASR